MRPVSLLVSLFPFILLITLLMINVSIFHDEATSGANQLALIITGVITIIVGCFYLGIPYQVFEQRITESIGYSTQALLILLTVGSLISMWILSGIVPTMIFYGLKLLNPSIFLPLACLVCAIVSVCTGSSWSTTATIGIAIIGIGKTLEVPDGMVAGAVISGAYFGDKMSPLSDTTNLAPTMVNVELITHIRHMVYTTLPALLLALIGFTLLGIFYTSSSVTASDINDFTEQIDSYFAIGPQNLLIPIIVLVMIGCGVKALVALVSGTMLGALGVIVFQQELLVNLLGADYSMRQLYTLLITSAYGGVKFVSGHALMDQLFSRGGMQSMMVTIWLVYSAMIFGGAVDAAGMLKKIGDAILSLAHGVGSLIATTLLTCIFVNLTACDQYLAIIIPSRMFQKAYRRMNLHAKNLSRALEDGGTVTSPLVPWSSGGAYQSSTLGVATLEYLPYCFFNLLCPIISAFLAGFDLTIERLAPLHSKQSTQQQVTAKQHSMVDVRS